MEEETGDVFESLAFYSSIFGGQNGRYLGSLCFAVSRFASSPKIARITILRTRPDEPTMDAYVEQSNLLGNEQD